MSTWMSREDTSRLKELKQYFSLLNKSREYANHSSQVHSLGWSCDGRRLASGSTDNTVAIFSLDRNGLSKDFSCQGHSGSVEQLCWNATHPDLLSIAGGGKSVYIWDVRSQEYSVIKTKRENLNITWAPDGNTIAVGNKEGLVTFIDTRTLKIKAEKQFNFEVNEISWNNISSLFFVTGGKGCVHVLSFPELELQKVLKDHTATCICIDFDRFERYFATGGADAVACLWDANELCCVRTFTRLDRPVRSISFSHDGQMLASASEDLLIDIAQVETSAKITEIPVETATLTVAWHPKQYLLAYACDVKDKYSEDSDNGILKVFGYYSIS